MEKSKKKKYMYVLKTLVEISGKCPRLPKLRTKTVLPFLPLIFSPSTALLLTQTCQLYGNIQTIYETVSQPLEYYQTLQNVVVISKQTAKKISKMSSRCPPSHDLMISEQDRYIQKLCDSDSSEWILLFPDNEHCSKRMM